MRILMIIDNQVRSLRKRQVVGSFLAKLREGAYWSIHGDCSVDDIGSGLNCPTTRSAELAAIDTRLKKLDTDTQRRLINWGYATCDNGLRRFVDRAVAPPNGFPFADVGV
jgi:NTE family protein